LNVLLKINLDSVLRNPNILLETMKKASKF